MNQEFLLDVQWWRDYARLFNGSATMISYNFIHGPWFCTNASSVGYGIYSNGNWMAGCFANNYLDVICKSNFEQSHGHWFNIIPPLLRERDDNVNFWELIPVIPDTLSRLSDPLYVHKFNGYLLCCRYHMD